MTYNEFIDDILNTRGRFACGEEYHERHHIIPKCMNGTDAEDNLIDLYAREHFIAHKLLVQENPDNFKLVYAWHMMSTTRKNSELEITPEAYEEARIAYSKMLKEKYSDPSNHPMFGKTLSEETRKKISDAHMGKTYSDEYKQKLRDSWTDERRQQTRNRVSGENGFWFGKHFSEEHRTKISEALSGERNPMYGRCGELNPMFDVHRYGDANPFYGRKHTEETKTKISNAKKGIPQSAESNRKRSKSEQGSKNPRARKVIRLNDLKIYDCLDYAANDNDMHRDTIRKRCKKYNGFMYYDEYLTQQNNLENNIC